MKKALTLAAKRLQEWAKENNKEAAMDLLYPFVVEIACTNGLRFFYGDDEGLLQSHMDLFRDDMEFCQEFDEPFDYSEFAQKAKPVPGLYVQQLLKQIYEKENNEIVSYKPMDLSSLYLYSQQATQEDIELMTRDYSLPQFEIPNTIDDMVILYQQQLFQ